MRTLLRKPCVAITLALQIGLVSTVSASPQSAEWTLTYVLRPSLSERSLSITAVLIGDVSGGVLWRGSERTGSSARRTLPQAQDAFGQPLRVTAHPLGWSVRGGGAGGMRVTYSVESPDVLPSGAAGIGLGPEALYAPGYDLFLLPEAEEVEGAARPEGVEMGRIEVVFDVPVSWRTIVPWRGYGRSYRPENLTELHESIVATGDFRRHSVRIAGMEIQVGIQGSRPGADSSLLEIVRRVVLAGQEIYGPPPSTALTVLLPESGIDGAPALHIGRCVAIAWNESASSIGDIGDGHRLTRELLSVWDSGAGGEPRWVSAGMRDYTAWLVLLRQNLIQPDTFRQAVLQAERAYTSHPHAQEWTFAQEQARRDELPASQVPLADSRGLLVALALDATLARASAGRVRLTDMLRTVYTERREDPARDPGVIRESDLMRACAALTQGDYLDEFFRSLVFGTGRPPTVEALADIMERERKDRP